MQKNSDGINEFSMKQAMDFAKSDAGKQLLALLQSKDADQLQAAMDQAAAGDMLQAKKTVEQLVASKEAQNLLKQMRGDING